MVVDDSMRIEFGTTRMRDYADVLGTDEETGVQVTADRGDVRMKLDSLSTRPGYVDLDPDTADALADLLHRRAAEARL